ncbi:hypothetical protein QCA50_014857 [Cerrena zonata]|uniref:Hydrophobin n=1 Tax=Cerrena zonata TaxID=2478898 RepID=A0AAW0FYN2_9APHY
MISPPSRKTTSTEPTKIRNMFPRLITFSTLAFALLAVATPARRNEPASSCSTGPIQCCENTETAGSKSGATLLESIGVIVQDVNVLLGVTCSPVSVIGVGGDSCSASPVCCENNSFGSLVSIGCVPVDLTSKLYF